MNKSRDESLRPSHRLLQVGGRDCEKKKKLEEKQVVGGISQRAVLMKGGGGDKQTRGTEVLSAEESKV